MKEDTKDIFTIIVEGFFGMIVFFCLAMLGDPLYYDPLSQCIIIYSSISFCILSKAMIWEHI